MALSSRSQSTDFFSMNKFWVTDAAGILNLAAPAAGFNTCSSPEMTISVAEYQEGIDAYRRKYPGEPSFGPITLTKGVVKTDVTMFQWILSIAENQPYRTDISIYHFHRDDVAGLINYQQSTPTRILKLKNAFGTRVKLGSDFDGMASEISIEDLDIEYESLALFVNGTEVLNKSEGY
jgi:phage tail-like protein